MLYCIMKEALRTYTELLALDSVYSTQGHLVQSLLVALPQYKCIELPHWIDYKT